MISFSYLAGLFDGEGCIDLQRMYAKPPYDKKVYVRPRVRITMSDSTLFLAARLQDEFGGYIGRRKAQNERQQSSWSIEWLNRDAIVTILKKMLPYLILKQEQAKLALWWLENASGRSNQSSIIYGIDQAREILVEEMREMKRDALHRAEYSIERIKACFTDKNIVSIR